MHPIACFLLMWVGYIVGFIYGRKSARHEQRMKEAMSLMFELQRNPPKFPKLK
jgi:hypothetical protein